jgi:hypothetical protein
MHYCVLTATDLELPDTKIKDKIQIELALWKQRALKGGARAPHGFMLVVAAPRVLWAAPDENLKRLALRIRQLWGCRVEADDRGNDRAWEHLFLKKPKTSEYYRFTFTVDFFAAAADGRWWHDHRAPGGIAFTANSLGHMAAVREWYEGKKNQTEWGARVAMLTIAEAADTTEGPATTLIPLNGGEPIKNVACPFSGTSDDLPASLRDKDWTSYQGVLHTDHSVRAEFFDPKDKPPLLPRPWFMDFTYIFDPSQVDHVQFMRGQLVAEEEVFGELGPPGEWRTLSARRSPRSGIRPRRTATDIGAMLAKTSGWSMKERELKRLLR